MLSMAVAKALAKEYTDSQLQDLGIESMSYYFCSSGEYNASTGVPNVTSPNNTTFYIAPAVGSGNGAFNVYIYKNNAWVLFKSLTLDMTNMPIDDSLTMNNYAADAATVGDEITALKADLLQISQPTRNLFDDSVLKNAAGISLGQDGYYYGTVSAWAAAFSDELPIDGEYVEGQRYSLSFTYFYSDTESYSGSGLLIKIAYADETTGNVITSSDHEEPYGVAVHSANGKTVSKLYLINADARAKNYVVHIKDIQIETGEEVTDYVNHYTAKDLVAEERISEIVSTVEGIGESVQSLTTEYNTLHDDVSAYRNDYITGTLSDKVVLQASDFSQGAWGDSGAFTENTDRICMTLGVFVPAGTVVNYDLKINHGLGYRIFPNQVGTAGNNKIEGSSSWKTGTGTLTTSNTGYLVIYIQNNGGTYAPTDYNDNVWFLVVSRPQWMEDMESDISASNLKINDVRSDYINGITTETIDLGELELKQGSWTDSGESDSSSDRIATSTGYYLAENTPINYFMASGHRLGVKIFSQQVGTMGNRKVGGTGTWQTGSGIYYTSAAGYVVITVQVASGTLEPSDYNESIWFVYTQTPQWIANLQSMSENVESHVMPPRIINPNFNLIKLPEVTQWNSAFQNFFEFGNEIWFCTASSEFSGESTNGVIFRVSKSDYSYIGRIWHNLGHMAQVDYDAVADRMLMCNTESSTQPMLYIFHDVSDWLTIAGNNDNVLTAANLDYDTIDLTALRTAHMPLYYTIACWAERQTDGNRLIVGEGYHGRQWFKLMLGMGTNNLGEGTYVAATADHYNGSYKTIWYKDCPLEEVPGRDTPQANQGLICYNGQFWEGFGHEPCYGGIFTPLITDYVHRDIFDLQFFNPDGTVLGGLDGGCVTEGVNIIDGKLCMGISGDNTKTYLIILDV